MGHGTGLCRHFAIKRIYSGGAFERFSLAYGLNCVTVIAAKHCLAIIKYATLYLSRGGEGL